MYQFITGVGDKFDGEKRDLLKGDPKPTLEETYVVIRTERDWRLVMGSEHQSGGPSLVNTSRIGARLSMKPPSESLVAKNALTNKIGQGFSTKPHSDPVTASVAPSSLCDDDSDKNKLKCSHCGKFCHSKDECYQIVGYP